jgi:hypothetical protein
VATTPFYDVPRARFLRRMIIPSIFIFSTVLIINGIIYNTPEFQNHPGPAAVLPFWHGATQVYRELFSKLSQMPGLCWAGDTANDFQAHQCQDYWETLEKNSILAILPFIVSLFFVHASVGKLDKFYRRAEKKAASGRAIFGGTVTFPAEGPQDLFGWYYCLRPIMVELKNKSQRKLYIPLGAPIPVPGDILAAFSETQSFGQKRHLALVYAPHVAVVRGG